MSDLTEEVILGIALAIEAGAKLSDLHKVLLSKGWSEDEIFIFIKASQLLVKYRI